VNAEAELKERASIAAPPTAGMTVLFRICIEVPFLDCGPADEMSMVPMNGG
jgi:hypothetical protein